MFVNEIYINSNIYRLCNVILFKVFFFVVAYLLQQLVFHHQKHSRNCSIQIALRISIEIFSDSINIWHYIEVTHDIIFFFCSFD